MAFTGYSQQAECWSEMLGLAFLLVHLLTYASEFTGVEVLFDIRTLDVLEARHAITETAPLIDFNLSDDD
jgi:hypothetical protein